MKEGQKGYIVFSGLDRTMNEEYEINYFGEYGIRAKSINTADTYFIPYTSILHIRIIEDKK